MKRQLTPSGLLGLSPRLVFHHIPKTAGTSVHDEISSYFQLEKTCPERFPVLDSYSYTELMKFELFSGHFDKYTIDRIPTPKWCITFLRDPIKRLLSLYYFWRSHRWDEIEAANLQGPRLAKSMSLLNFLRYNDPTIAINFNNAMCASFLGRNATSPTFWCKYPDAEFFADWALENLKRYCFVGFVEFFDEDMERLRAHLGFEQGEPPKTLNTAQSSLSQNREAIDYEEITPEIEAELLKLTKLDRLFYTRALAMRDHLMSSFPM